MPHPLSDEVGRLRAALAAQALAFEERDQLWEKHASGMKRVAEGLWGIFEEEDGKWQVTMTKTGRGTERTRENVYVSESES